MLPDEKGYGKYEHGAEKETALFDRAKQAISVTTLISRDATRTHAHQTFQYGQGKRREVRE